MSRTVKAPYTGPKRFSVHCRCHGGCSYCESSRLRYRRIGDDLLKQGLGEIELGEVKRRSINGLDIPDRKGSPRRVDIDLSEAFTKIKRRLKDSP